MGKLLLSLNGEVQGEFQLNKERMTIGRKTDNDVRIDNPAVSGRHALVITILDDSFLEDLGSTPCAMETSSASASMSSNMSTSMRVRMTRISRRPWSSDRAAPLLQRRRPRVRACPTPGPS